MGQEAVMCLRGMPHYLRRRRNDSSGRSGRSMEPVGGATGFVPLLTAVAVTLHDEYSAPLIQIM